MGDEFIAVHSHDALVERVVHPALQDAADIWVVATQTGARGPGVGCRVDQRQVRWLAPPEGRVIPAK